MGDFVSKGSLGTVQEKTSDTTIVLTVTGTAQVGDLVAVLVTVDNLGTTDGETSQLSIADSAGNTWTKVREQTESSGVAADGLTAAIFVCRVTTQIDSGVDTITVTSTSAVTAKAMEAWAFSAVAGTVMVAAVSVGNAGSGQPPALSLTGLEDGQHYLNLYLLGMERESTALTLADYSQMTGVNTAGGAADTNQYVIGAYKVEEGNVESIAPATGTGAQNVSILAALYVDRRPRRRQAIGNHDGTNGPSAAAVSSLATQWPADTVTGSLVWVWVWVSHLTPREIEQWTVTDSQSNVYTLVAHENETTWNSGGATGSNMALFVCESITGGTTPTVTFTMPTTHTHIRLCMGEYANAKLPVERIRMMDVAETFHALAGQILMPSVRCQPRNLAIGCVQDIPGNGPYSAGPGWTLIADANIAGDAAAVEKVALDRTHLRPSFSESPTGASWGMSFVIASASDQHYERSDRARIRSLRR